MSALEEIEGKKFEQEIQESHSDVGGEGECDAAGEKRDGSRGRGQLGPLPSFRTTRAHGGDPMGESQCRDSGKSTFVCCRPRVPRDYSESLSSPLRIAPLISPRLVLAIKIPLLRQSSKPAKERHHVHGSRCRFWTDVQSPVLVIFHFSLGMDPAKPFDGYWGPAAFVNATWNDSASRSAPFESCSGTGDRRERILSSRPYRKGYT